MLVDRASQRIARPIPAGWALDAILRCDAEHGSFLRRLHHASSLRRQGVFLALTQIDWDRPDVLASSITRTGDRSDVNGSPPLALIADHLLRLRVRDLVHAIFGPTSQGLVGALARCGEDPLDEFSYQLLVAMHVDPANRARASLLRDVAEINDALVEVVWGLPAALLRVEVLRHIRQPEDIRRYSSVLKVIRRLHPQVTDDDLLTSLANLAPGTNLAIWARRWIEKAACLPTALPYAGDETLRPLVSGEDMKRTALKYQNCLRGKIAVVALGRACFYEYAGSGGAVAEVAALSNGHWVLDGIYGVNNCRPAPEAVRSIRFTLEKAGVLVVARYTHSADLNTVADLLHLYEYNGGPGLDLEPTFDMAA
ncbi:MAG: hypothetical protein JWM36_2270 [Hyphomicrobiales bacterium]|nr:hypothetical protein [Hyphomicrobiales bacterium]